MKIRDILNREIVNLTNCEHEPIHIPGSIQPHGFLLGLKTGTWLIDFCSANTSDYIGISHTELLGRTFATAFGDEREHLFKEYISHALVTAPLKLELFGRNFNCTIHISGAHYILEAEPLTHVSAPLSSIYDQTSQFLAYMNETHTLKELCQLVADGTREITGYDRVMVYRFDKDYNGEVFAESRDEKFEPFLGLHYPHTDIPVQARELYLKNLLRLIADIGYKPVPIYTIDDTHGKNLDLSHSILRSTSPIHIQYLQNMGVGATLTISLIHQKKLWGLIACHHYSPKNLTPEIRLAAQLQGNFLTSQIDVRQSNEEYEVSRKTNAALEKLNALHLSPKSESFEQVIACNELLEICNAGGVSIKFGNEIFTSGSVPEHDEILMLSDWLFNYTNAGQLHTDKLLGHLHDHKELCQKVPGIVYHSLGLDADNCVIWYRPETIAEVNWAGDPAKAIVKDEKGLFPRKSFELWREFVKYQSKPWSTPELNSAANYAHSLQRQMALILLTEESRRNLELNQILKETNSELENINWISTHDLQEPLRKIQLIASRLLSKENDISPDVIDAILRMNQSASRMQALLVDILKYTRIQHTKAIFEKVKLENLVQQTVEELKEAVTEKMAIVKVNGLPEINGVAFLLKQLFSNLISNSLKYSKDDTASEILVDYQGREPNVSPTDRDALFEVIRISDNGIGFEQQFSENIFNIFTRLHPQAEYKGSGVGLALCKKIMQTHSGFIKAEGTPDSGAVFTLYFPVN
ncbi:GAF domain-containing protein [Flavobacterium sp. MAH-1]|uniref:histidine kinase n=1 Tax=Flavobacterium agri TaxID=2743471 RepID=A0A7Y8Y3Y1_9FLAO|nr:ATP-binding protein [Flavobacterium agri]NUY82135.1 GAF domain-containing protein [Flavobacterium agri]NYA72159.1 GAF domain-containing protein [Flavobacterium agri]